MTAYRFPLITTLCACLSLTACLNKGSSNSAQTVSGGKSNSLITDDTNQPDTSPIPSPSPVAFSLKLNATSVAAGSTLRYSAIGGKPPYEFRLISASGGTLNPDGTLVAPSSPAIIQLEATDAVGTTLKEEIHVTVPGVQPNDTRFGLMAQLGPGGINAEQGWAIQTDCSAVKVAVVDTGVDLTHTDFKNQTNTVSNLIGGVNIVPRLSLDANGEFVYEGGDASNNNPKDTTNPQDDGYHGTHVAGAIGAYGNNARTATGVCWTAQIIPVKVLMKVDYRENGVHQFYSFEAPSSAVADGIKKAADLGAKIINLSVGGEDDGSGSLYSAAFNYAQSKGALMVTAAGNDGKNMDRVQFLPGGLRHPAQITVGATDPGKANQVAPFSNYSLTNRVQIAAPGVDNLSLLPRIVTPPMTEDKLAINFGMLSGTSMAAPLVAGALALYWSHRIAAGEPANVLTPAQIRADFLGRAKKLPVLEGSVENARFLDLGDILYGR